MTTKTAFSRSEIEEGVIAILGDMVQDWDMDLTDPIGPDSKIIGDLGFESIDLVQLVVEIEKRFSVRGLPYEELIMEDGRYVTEISVGQMVDFLSGKIGQGS